MRALIDTCVIIDVLQSREPFASDAQKIFLLAANEQFIGCISAKSVTDIYYLTHRLTHDDKASRAVLGKLFTLFEVADTAGMDCRRAIPSEISDYEDAVMIETALRTEVDCIVTRNTRDYSKSPITVYSPSEFIKRLEEEQE
ncbi:MAG: PIN domain-containing protein [Lachnospiraceae bacterium]|nr:PIN domain-containing protein [Lachnospiraceae bacterium]